MRINFKGNSAKRAKLTEEFNIAKSNIVYKILNCDSHKLNKEWHNYPFDVKMPHIIISKEYKISRNSKYSYESLSLARKARKADVKAKAKAISAASKTVKPSDLYGEIKELKNMIKTLRRDAYNIY